MSLSYFAALWRLNLSVAWRLRRQYALTSLIMLSQNLMFFAIWIIFFHTAGSVRGWTLHDLLIFNGIVTFGVGLALLLADGTRKIGFKVLSGALDTFLTRPRHPLPQLMLIEGNNAGFGDMAFGLLLLGAAGLSLESWLLALAAAGLIGLLFLMITVIFQTLVFYMRGGDRLADQLFEMLICLGTIPQQAQGGVMKLLLFTVLPAGFMVILPVEMVRRGSLPLLGWLACAVAGYALLALVAFNLGLRRYTSATGWKV